jgi:P4 family phage/plasmid primase-like protien
MDATGFLFKDINEISEFIEMTETQQSRHFVKSLNGCVKAFGKNASYYIYNDKIRLWKETKELEFNAYMFEWFDKTATNIRAMVGNLKDKRIETLIKNFDKRAYVNSILDRCIGLLYDEDFISTLNDSADFLPIQGGKKIDLRTLKISDRQKEDKFTFECNVTLTKTTKKAEKLFTDYFPDMEIREYVRRCLGYMLTGSTKARCFFVFYGVGKNGKSLIATLLDLILKNYYHQCSEDVFKEKTNTGGATPHMYALMGKRVGVYSEGETADKMELNFSNLKKISGEDKISARGLFRDPIDFYSPIKLIMLTNYTPPLSAEKAVKDRIRYIFFDERFVESPEGNEKQENKEFVQDIKTIYLNEVFTWIVQGSKAYYETNSLIVPEAFEKRTIALLKNEDSIETFMTRFVTKTDKASDYIKTKDLFEKYKKFCDANSQRCQPRSTLYNRIDHMKFTKSILHGIDIFRNMKCSYNDVDTGDDDYQLIDDSLLRKAHQLNETLKAENEELKQQIAELTAKYEPVANDDVKKVVKKMVIKKSKPVERSVPVVQKKTKMVEITNKDHLSLLELLN